MRVTKLFVALTLALSLAVPVWAAPDQAAAQGRQEDLNVLYDTLRQHHPNLFANSPEEVFLARKGEIESSLRDTDDLTFALDLQTLAALTGDSHTTLNLTQMLTQYQMPVVGIQWMEGRWVLSAADVQYKELLGWTVTGANGFSMAEIQQRLSALLCADNQVKLRRQVGQIFAVEDFFAYCGLAQRGQAWTLDLEGPKGETRALTLPLVSSADRESWPQLARLAQLRAASAPTDAQNRYYFSLPLDERAYYIQYNLCREDPELPMADFVAQVKADLSEGAYTKVLIDLRNNGGGSDGVLQPLLTLLAPGLRAGEYEVWGLIGETTFSSAGINAMMIKEMGGFLAGEETSGSVDHFGEVGSFTLPNSGLKVSMSQKDIRMSDYMECGIGLGVAPIQPDLEAVQTLEDYLAGRDTVVDTLLARTQPFSLPAQPDAPLTRGRLVELLRQTAGQAGLDTAAPDTDFWDCFPFAWFDQGVDWAVANGVASGSGEGRFYPARPVTRQEAAVILAQAARLLGRETGGSAQLADQNAVAPWALQAAQNAVAQGWMTLDQGAFRPLAGMTRGEGEALAAGLLG